MHKLPPPLREVSFNSTTIPSSLPPVFLCEPSGDCWVLSVDTTRVWRENSGECLWPAECDWCVSHPSQRWTGCPGETGRWLWQLPASHGPQLCSRGGGRCLAPGSGWDGQLRYAPEDSRIPTNIGDVRRVSTSAGLTLWLADMTWQAFKHFSCWRGSQGTSFYKYRCFLKTWRGMRSLESLPMNLSWHTNHRRGQAECDALLA